jgi:hypothetical protein
VNAETRRNLAELDPCLRRRVLALDEPVARDDWADVVRRWRACLPWARRVLAIASIMGAVAAC